MSEIEENEFVIIATFSNWLKIYPELIKLGYKRVTVIDNCGYPYTYFKKETPFYPTPNFNIEPRIFPYNQNQDILDRPLC